MPSTLCSLVLHCSNACYACAIELQGVAEFAQCRHRERLPSAAFETTDEDVSSDLLRAVERMRLDIDAVYEANGLAETESPLRTAHMHSDVRTGVALEVIANKVLPFDVQATSDAVWRHFALAKECTPCRGYTYSAYEVRHSLAKALMLIAIALRLALVLTLSVSLSLMTRRLTTW